MASILVSLLGMTLLLLYLGILERKEK